VAASELRWTVICRRPARSADGFRRDLAHFLVSTNANERFQQCGEDRCEALHATMLGVRLIEPVERLSHVRALREDGFLFVFLTFGAFFC